MPGPPPPARPETGSPAAVLSLVAGVLGLLVSFNSAAYILSLFLSAVALAALPMALADHAGPRSSRKALIGGGAAVLAIVLVVVPLLTGDAAKAGRQPPAPARGSLPAPSPRLPPEAGRGPG